MDPTGRTETAEPHQHVVPSLVDVSVGPRLAWYACFQNPRPQQDAPNALHARRALSNKPRHWHSISLSLSRSRSGSLFVSPSLSFSLALCLSLSLPLRPSLASFQYDVCMPDFAKRPASSVPSLKAWYAYVRWRLRGPIRTCEACRLCIHLLSFRQIVDSVYI